MINIRETPQIIQLRAYTRSNRLSFLFLSKRFAIAIPPDTVHYVTIGACLVSRHAHLACIFSVRLRQFFLKYIQYYCEKLPSSDEKSAARSARVEILNRL